MRTLWYSSRAQIFLTIETSRWGLYAWLKFFLSSWVLELSMSEDNIPLYFTQKKHHQFSDCSYVNGGEKGRGGYSPVCRERARVSVLPASADILEV
jgi:hypothetical protein